MPLYRDSARYLLGRGVPAVISLLTAGVYTRLVPPDELGLFVITLALASFANAVLFQWLGAGIVRFAPRYADRRSSFLKTVRVAFTAAAVVALLLAAVLWMVLEGHPARSYVPLGAVALCALALFEVHLDLMRSRLATGLYSATFLLRSALTLLLSWQLARLGYGSSGLLLGFAAGWALAPMPMLRFVWRGIGAGEVDPKLLRQLLRYGMPLTMTVLLESFVMTSDRLFLSWLRGPEDAGLYGVAAQLATNTLRVVLQAVSLAILPLAAQAFESRGATAARDELEKGLSVLLAIGLPATVGLSLLAGNIAHVVLGAEYRNAAATLLPVIALAMLLYGLRHFYVDQSFHLGRRTEVQVRIAAIAAVVTVALNLALVPSFGMIGSAWSLVASQALALALSWRFSRQIFPLSGPGFQLFRIGFAVALMAPVVWWLAPGRGPQALAAQIMVGTAAYAAGLFLTDGAQARTLLLEWLRSRRPA